MESLTWLFVLKKNKHTYIHTPLSLTKKMEVYIVTFRDRSVSRADVEKTKGVETVDWFPARYYGGIVEAELKMTEETRKALAEAFAFCELRSKCVLTAS